MAKLLKFDKEARDKLIDGINILADAVGSTLGPKGRNVAIMRFNSPLVVHDGVTVAKEIELPDPFENMGVQILKEAASKTNDVAGDGTTTATVLARAMVTEGVKYLNAGSNPMDLKKGIEKAVDEVVKQLEKMSKKLSTPAEIEQVATISANDKQIGKLIAEAFGKLGKDGVITVEEGNTIDMNVEYTEGMQFDKGFASPFFITDSEKMESSVDDPYILLTDKKISTVEELLPFLEKLVAVSKNLVIIADEVEGQALATLVVNKLRGGLNVLALSAPGFGDRKKANLEDIAILTGGVVISEDMGRKLDSVEIVDLGRASKVTSSKDKTIIVGGKGDKLKLEQRINQIKLLIDQTDSEYDKKSLQERLAKLVGGVAVINVGAATEIEMKEKKERVIDAVSATRAAIEEGIIAGGETALLRSSDIKLSLNKDQQLGVEIVKKALVKPFELLISNAGIEVEQLVDKVLASRPGFGVDVIDGELKDLIKEGIIDPVKVTRSALQNAASVAVMVMTTNVLIVDAPTPPQPSQPLHNHGMEDY